MVAEVVAVEAAVTVEVRVTAEAAGEVALDGVWAALQQVWCWPLPWTEDSAATTEGTAGMGRTEEVGRTGMGTKKGTKTVFNRIRLVRVPQPATQAYPRQLLGMPLVALGMRDLAGGIPVLAVGTTGVVMVGGEGIMVVEVGIMVVGEIMGEAGITVVEVRR